jgi:hypothetical protein
MHSSFSPASKIDLVFNKGDEYVVVIVHTGEWDSSNEEQEGLKEKLRACAQFILGGQFQRMYPDANKVRIQIDAPSEPPPMAQDIINQANNYLAKHNVRVGFGLI